MLHIVTQYLRESAKKDPELIKLNYLKSLVEANKVQPDIVEEKSNFIASFLPSVEELNLRIEAREEEIKMEVGAK